MPLRRIASRAHRPDGQNDLTTNAAGHAEWDNPTKGGTTGARPGSPFLYQIYFDTTLHYLVTWDGANWRNGAGAIV